MTITPKQYATALLESVRGKEGKELAAVLDNFTAVLVRNNDISKTVKILAIFSSLWNKEHGIIEVKVITAKQLEKSELDAIGSALARTTKAKTAIVSGTTNKEIIGGAIIRYGDTVIDQSIRTKINDLTNAIKH